MITIRKILVPTDFSNVSVPAIGYALSLAKMMTSRGRSRLRSLFADSYTERVVRKAPCPVLSIQPSANVRTENNERVSVRMMEQTGAAF